MNFEVCKKCLGNYDVTVHHTVDGDSVFISLILLCIGGFVECMIPTNIKVDKSFLKLHFSEPDTESNHHDFPLLKAESYGVLFSFIDSSNIGNLDFGYRDDFCPYALEHQLCKWNEE